MNDVLGLTIRGWTFSFGVVRGCVWVFEVGDAHCAQPLVLTPTHRLYATDGTEVRICFACDFFFFFFHYIALAVM